MDVKQVKVLNEKIEDIQVKRTKAETKREMLMSRLSTEIAKYEETYGVKLSGKSIKDIVKKVSSEFARVTQDIESEYKLKQKVVEAIETGDIAEANKLLGIEVVVEEEEYEVEEPEVEETSEEKVSSVSEELEVSAEDDLDFGVEFDEDEVSEEQDGITTDEGSDDDSKVDDFDFDIGDIEDEEPETKVSNIGSSADEVVEELESGSDDEDIYSDLGDMDFDDFGFGDMLSGSKLDI